MLLLNALSVGQQGTSYFETAHSWGPIYPILVSMTASGLNVSYVTTGLILSSIFSTIVLLLLPLLSLYLFNKSLPGFLVQAGLLFTHMFFDLSIRLEIHSLGYLLLILSVFSGINFCRNPSAFSAFFAGAIAGFSVLGRIKTLAVVFSLFVTILIARSDSLGSKSKNARRIEFSAAMLGVGSFLIPFFTLNWWYNKSLFPPGRWLHLSQDSASLFYPDFFPYSYAEWFEVVHLNYSLIEYLLSFPLQEFLGFLVNIYLFFFQLFFPRQVAILFIFLACLGGIYLFSTFFKNNLLETSFSLSYPERVFLTSTFFILLLMPMFGQMQSEMHHFLDMGIVFSVAGLAYLFDDLPLRYRNLGKWSLGFLIVGLPFYSMLSPSMVDARRVQVGLHAHEAVFGWNRGLNFRVSRRDIPSHRQNFKPLSKDQRKNIIKSIAKDRGLSAEEVVNNNSKKLPGSKIGRSIRIASHFHLSSIYEMGFSPMLIRPPSFGYSLEENLCYRRLPTGYAEYFNRFFYPPQEDFRDHLPPDYILILSAIEKQFTDGKKSSHGSKDDILYFRENLKLLHEEPTHVFSLPSLPSLRLIRLYKVPETLTCNTSD